MCDLLIKARSVVASVDGDGELSVGGAGAIGKGVNKAIDGDVAWIERIAGVLIGCVGVGAVGIEGESAVGARQ